MCVCNRRISAFYNESTNTHTYTHTIEVLRTWTIEMVEWKFIGAHWRHHQKFEYQLKKINRLRCWPHVTVMGGCVVAFECRIYILHHNYSCCCCCWLDFVLGNSFEWPSFLLLVRANSRLTISHWNGEQFPKTRELFSFHRFAFEFYTWKLECCHAEMVVMASGPTHQTTNQLTNLCVCVWARVNVKISGIGWARSCAHTHTQTQCTL